MVDVKSLKVGQQVFLASARLIEESKESLPYLVLPVSVTKTYPSPSSPTFYADSPMRVSKGPWQAEEAYLDEREALIAGVKLATRAIEQITRESQQRVGAILRVLDGFAPSIIANLGKDQS